MKKIISVSPLDSYVIYVEGKGYWCAKTKMKDGEKYFVFSDDITNIVKLYDSLFTARKIAKELITSGKVKEEIKVLWIRLDSQVEYDV